VNRSPWRDAAFWALPVSVALQFLLPVLSALVVAPSQGLLCTASYHGYRAVPCGVTELLLDWLRYVLLSNLLFFGLPTLALCAVSFVVLGPLFTLRARRGSASHAPE
jgi:hypothetical protein